MPAPTKDTTQPVEPGSGLNAELFLVVTLTMVVTCFHPLTRYFFAQDDFTLMLKASSDPGGMLASFFGSAPGQFRPLTKTLYFALMYKVFGLSAAPYHIVSIAWHIMNSALVFLLMRRLRIGGAPALVATAMFALNTAFFHVLAWASCIQQLMAMTFVLVTLILGIDGVRSGSPRKLWASTASYALALTCLEQTFATPIALFIIGYFGIGAGKARPALGKLTRMLRGHLALMLLYGVFMLAWKGIPHEGVYRFAFGGNIIINLLLYLKWLVSYWALLPSSMAATTASWSILHVVLLYIIVYNLVRMRFAETLLGTTIVVVFLLPVLFLEQHSYFLHTYLPAIGVSYLLGLMLHDFFEIHLLRRDVVRIPVLTITLVVVFGLSFIKIRENVTATLTDAKQFPSSFVLRRAKIARQVRVDLEAKIKDPANINELFMVYARKEGADEASWNYRNVVEALGEGDAVRLFLSKPDMAVNFSVVGDTLQVPEKGAEVIYFGDFGNCLTQSEASAIGEGVQLPGLAVPTEDTR